MRRRRARPTDETEVNMTPMLDIVFILLIFFIVTATFLNESGMDLTPPPPSPPTKEKTLPSVRIYIDESNLIQVDGRLTDIGSLRASIERRKAEIPEISVVIQAHPRSKNKFVIQAVDMAKSADVGNIALVGSQEE